MRGRRTGRGSGAGTVALVALVCTPIVFAQPPGQAPTAPPAPPPTVGRIQQGAPQPTFRAGVTLATTDVIVRDRDGVFVSDLTRDSFRILEDGVEQEIASLVMVHGGRVFNMILPPAPVQEGLVLPQSRPPSDTAGRVFLLFVDDLHLRSSSTLRVRQVFRQIGEELIHEGDLFGVISTGPSAIAIDMTYDRSRLLEAENRIIGDGRSVREMMMAQNSARGPAELLYRAHVAFKTARDVLRNLEEVTNRRKAFIYISNGYDFDPFPEAGGYSGNLLTDPVNDPFGLIQRQEHVFADTDLSGELVELARVANRANTSFYTLDPRGLTSGPGVDEKVSIEAWNDYIFKTQNSLRMLAEMTDGMAIVNRNSFKTALQEIDAETSDYYIVGFYTSNPDPTVQLRRLDVEIVGQDDDDLDVRTRTHYSLPREPA